MLEEMGAQSLKATAYPGASQKEKDFMAAAADFFKSYPDQEVARKFQIVNGVSRRMGVKEGEVMVLPCSGAASPEMVAIRKTSATEMQGSPGSNARNSFECCWWEWNGVEFICVAFCS